MLTNQPEKEERHEITLIPMRPGPLLLPTVTTAILPSSSSDSVNRGNDEQLLCETYLENAAEVVRVLPAKKTVRVMIPLINAGGGMVEQRREEWGMVA
jgi:hypothetical protein